MRVGRSVWELKIDPKRFRKEIKTISKEEDRKSTKRKPLRTINRASKSFESV